MATRSRAGSTRTTKSSPPPASDVTSDAASESTAEVTGRTLQRRELPSFSSSREDRIAEAAYWRAERRGFQSGQEIDDWLAAEKEIDGERDASGGEPPDGRTG